mmetsp:Transcript_51788/g.123240  ORF Transcript_51788/g.123240 Transcript_51788/m.123240 type:complete len:95 (+) Transcript_51788:104-388(+)
MMPSSFLRRAARLAHANLESARQGAEAESSDEDELPMTRANAGANTIPMNRPFLSSRSAASSDSEDAELPMQRVNADGHNRTGLLIQGAALQAH